MAVTASKPNAGWSWTRYVDSGQGFRRRSGGAPGGPSVDPELIDTAEHHQRPGPDVDLVALLDRLALAEARLPGDRRRVRRRRSVLGPQRQAVGVEDDDPVVAPVAARDRERQLLVVGVEEHEEAVVGDLLAPEVGVGNGVAVQEHADRLGETRVPVLLGHLSAVRREPADVGDLAAVDRAALEPPAAVE